MDWQKCSGIKRSYLVIMLTKVKLTTQLTTLS